MRRKTIREKIDQIIEKLEDIEVKGDLRRQLLLSAERGDKLIKKLKVSPIVEE